VTIWGRYSLKANFEPNSIKLKPGITDPDEYILFASSSTGGSVTTPGEGANTYKYGTQVNLVATPQTGYHFTDWSGVGVDWITDINDSTTTIAILDHYSLRANFELKPIELPPGDINVGGTTEVPPIVRLTIPFSPGGKVVRPGEGTFELVAGETIQIHAESKRHHDFDQWTGSLVDTGKVADPYDPNTTLIVSSHGTLKAHFFSNLDTIYVDDNAMNDPGPNDLSLSDPNEDGSKSHPFDSINEAIEVARQSVRLIIKEGSYYESINLMGKNILRN